MEAATSVRAGGIAGLNVALDQKFYAHRCPELVFRNMRTVAISCLRDNYAYLVICDETKTAAVVDPSASAPVLEAMARESDIELTAIWNTHHHWDHTGGNEGLLADKPELRVVGHVSDKGRVPGQTEFVDDGDVIAVGNIKAQIIFNPGHTSGAISYHIEEPAMVFTGDTLFGAGCGRLFEGTQEQMHASISRLGALPDQTVVFCGHEYTANNPAVCRGR